MRLFVSRPGYWGLEGVSELERQFLSEVPEAASVEGCPEAAERLFPSPMEVPESDGDMEFIEDWPLLVGEDLREQFGGDIATLIEDLRRLERMEVEYDQDDDEVVDVEEEDLPIYYAVEIPDDHAERWFSALNQARMVLAQKYQLYDEEGEESFLLDGIDLVEEDEDGEVDAEQAAALMERWKAHYQSHMYGAIQEGLIAGVMSRGLEGWGPAEEEDDDDDFLAQFFDDEEE